MKLAPQLYPLVMSQVGSPKFDHLYQLTLFTGVSDIFPMGLEQRFLIPYFINVNYNSYYNFIYTDKRAKSQEEIDEPRLL